MMKRNRGLWAIGAAAGILALAQVASAGVDVSTELPGSIVVFPKVLWTGVRDTVIQITNTSNNPAFVHCFYVNASRPGQWSETDFSLFLTKQQPTHWEVSTGRSFFGGGIDGAGFTPGLVPPLPFGFQGELKCIQTDPSGTPMRGNALKGEATLRTNTGDISEYNAIAFQGNPDAGAFDPRSTGPNDLALDLTPNTNSGTGDDTGEYSSCPNIIHFNHFADGTPDPVVQALGDCEPAQGGCPITTELTLVPCSENFETQTAGIVTVQFRIFNEHEQKLSASTTVNCWMNAQLAQISSAFTLAGFIGTPTAHTLINPNTGGVIGIAEETRRTDTVPGFSTATAAFNLVVEGNRFDAATNLDGVPVGSTTDHVVVPGE